MVSHARTLERRDLQGLLSLEYVFKVKKSVLSNQKGLFLISYFFKTNSSSEYMKCDVENEFIHRYKYYHSPSANSTNPLLLQFCKPFSNPSDKSEQDNLAIPLVLKSKREPLLSFSDAQKINMVKRHQMQSITIENLSTHNLLVQGPSINVQEFCQILGYIIRKPYFYFQIKCKYI